MKRTSLFLLGWAVLSMVPALHARPEFLARYLDDPFSRSDKTTCSTCHLNPSGGGPRNDFGKAFAANGFRITPSLRQQWPAWFQTTKVASLAQSGALGGGVKVTWSAAKENESLLQIGGDYFLMNRADGTVTKLNATEVAAFNAPPAPVAAEAVAAATTTQKPADDLDSRTLPTFDYFLIDLPTNRPRPKGEVTMRFTHRFDETLTGHTGSIRDLFGLDSTSSVSSFGIEGALTKWLALEAYRMPTRGQQTIEMGVHLSLLEQGKKSPVSLGFRATVEGELNFTERYTTSFQPVISRSVGTRAEFFVVPTFSIAEPRRTLTAVDFATRFGFPLTPGESRENAGAIGFGGSIRIRPKVAIVGEWIPRVYGFRPDNSSNSYSLGIQRRTNRHVFGLIVTNNSYTTTARSIINGQGDLRIGFNIARRLF